MILVALVVHTTALSMASNLMIHAPRIKNVLRQHWVKLKVPYGTDFWMACKKRTQMILREVHCHKNCEKMASLWVHTMNRHRTYGSGKRKTWSLLRRSTCHA